MGKFIYWKKICKSKHSKKKDKLVTHLDFLKIAPFSFVFLHFVYALRFNQIFIFLLL